MFSVAMSFCRSSVFFYFTNAIQYPYNISGSPALYFLTNSVNKFNDVIT